jgi:regulator of RNase E activity RraA
MTNIESDLVDYIRRNRVSTTEVADCLGKLGALPEVLPVNSGLFCAGPIFLTIAHSNSNWSVHEEIRRAPAGSIVVIETIDCDGRAIIGDLVAKYLTLYKQVAAIVVVGPVRDVPRIRREGWPVWSRGVSPIGCWNHEIPLTDHLDTAAKLRNQYRGCVVVCDDSGVVVIPSDFVTPNFMEALEAMELQEDMWYECVDRRKMSTFETVCLKNY